MRVIPNIQDLLLIMLSVTVMSLSVLWSSAPVLAASGDIAPGQEEKFLRFDGDPAMATDAQVIEALSGVRVSSIRFNYNVVRAVQAKLVGLGYDPHGVDGFWGPNTLRSLNAYRDDAGIHRRNFLDWGTLAHLFGVDYVRWKISHDR